MSVIDISVSNNYTAGMKQQQGFHLIIVAIVLLVVSGIGASGWYVWQKQHSATTRTASCTLGPPPKARVDNVEPLCSSQTPTVKKTDTTPATIKDTKLELANDTVSFTLDPKWTLTKSSTGCYTSVTADVACLEGASITPGVKMPTRYGNGTEFFAINVSVYQNPKHHSAETWLEEDLQEGIGTGNIQKSSDKINGYDTFYRVQQYDGDGTSVREIDYVYSAGSKAVLIRARTYEPSKLNDGTTVGDFRQFEPAISAMAKSVKITE